MTDNTVKTEFSKVDAFLGKYKHEDEMKIGDRNINDLVEIKEKNN